MCTLLASGVRPHTVVVLGDMLLCWGVVLGLGRSDSVVLGDLTFAGALHREDACEFYVSWNVKRCAAFLHKTDNIAKTLECDSVSSTLRMECYLG